MLISRPDILPAGESLIWALAKETGKFEKELRYPGEDDVYESPKMDARARTVANEPAKHVENCPEANTLLFASGHPTTLEGSSLFLSSVVTPFSLIPSLATYLLNTSVSLFRLSKGTIPTASQYYWIGRRSHD